MKRPGYTLLEVLLAAGIGVLVMAALYVAMEIQMRQTQVGREVVEESVLVRSLLTRLSQDIAASLPAPQAQPAATAAPATDTTPMSSESDEGATSALGSASFNLGLQGSFDRLEVQVSRPPRIPEADEAEEVRPEGDLRRITYWLTPGGLAREEVRLVTGESEPLDEAELIIAPEVRSIQFRYFDGTAWQESWDGTSADGTGTPLGPPLAVEIVLEVGPVSEEALLDPAVASQRWKRFRHVVALPTASLPVGESMEIEP